LGTGKGIGGGEILTRLCRWGGNSISVERVVEASDEERRIGGEGKIWGLEII